MSTGARIFFVGSLILTVGTVFVVNYYNNDEKQVFIFILIKKGIVQRKRANIMVDITRREDQHRSNMKQYENQLQIQDKLIQRDKQI